MEKDPSRNYLNTNDLAKKLDTLKETCTKPSIDVLCFETKVGSSFLDSQLYIPGY